MHAVQHPLQLPQTVGEGAHGVLILQLVQTSRSVVQVALQGGELAAQGAEICLGALDVRLQIFQALEQIDGIGPGQVHGLHGVVQDHVDGIHHLFGGGVGGGEQIVQGTNGDLALVDRAVPGRQESLDALVQVVGGAGEALENVQGIRNFTPAPLPFPQAGLDPVSLTSCWTAETPLSVIFGAMAFFFSLI